MNAMRPLLSLAPVAAAVALLAAGCGGSGTEELASKGYNVQSDPVPAA
jgi:hypothetical protein